MKSITKEKTISQSTSNCGEKKPAKNRRNNPFVKNDSCIEKKKPYLKSPKQIQ